MKSLRRVLRLTKPVDLDTDFRRCDDWTIFLTANNFWAAIETCVAEDQLGDLEGLKAQSGFDGEANFTFRGQKGALRGRYNFVRCFDEYIAMTFRSLKAVEELEPCGTADEPVLTDAGGQKPEGSSVAAGS